MAREIKILIPDQLPGEAQEIFVYRNNKPVMQYRSEIFQFNPSMVNFSRADFVKECIDNYDTNYEVAHIDLFKPHEIAIIFQRKQNENE